MIGKREAVIGGQALELTMREVMNTMEEAAVLASFEFAPGCVEILSVEAPSRAEVIPLPRRREPVALRAVS